MPATTTAVTAAVAATAAGSATAGAAVAGATSAVFTGIVAPLAIGAGVSALSASLATRSKGGSRAESDTVTSTAQRDAVVPFVFGRARCGGNYLLVGTYFRVALDSGLSGARLYILNSVLGIAEGPLRSAGGFSFGGRDDPKTAIRHRGRRGRAAAFGR